MSFHFKSSILFVSVLFVVCSLQATTRKVLFIGNSYTYTNNMPLMLQTFATAMGDTLIYDESDPGGYTLAMHSTYPATISKIFSQQWDLVVLQEQSQLPAFPPAEVDTEVYPFAHALDSMIHLNDTCTQTIFLMTWGHANGDPMNCPTYPAICTYEGMQERLRESYLQMTLDNNAIVAPVGAAWKVAHDSFPLLWLYQADSSHPVVAGSYLETCVLYSSIFHKRTYGCTYNAGLSTTDAQTLQLIADKVVVDSLRDWQQYGHYPYAGFKHTQSGNTVTFTYSSPIFSSYSWLFGDGVSDTSFAPVHTYTSPGNFVVSHTAFNDCFSETITDTITLGTTGINNAIKENLYPITVSQNGNGCVSFMLPEIKVYDAIEVFDIKGRCIRHYSSDKHLITDSFVPGIYILKAFSQDRKTLFYNKLVVY